MSSLPEIQAAIAELSPEDREALLSWLLNADRDAWDGQIERDFSAGGVGMQLLAEVDEEIRRGHVGELE